MRIGTDIVEIARIPWDNLAFIHGVLSKDETKLLESRSDKAQFVAGRFAAKEAFFKAMGTGLATGKLSDVDVSYRKDGSPILVFAGKSYEVSISHDGGYAIGVVLVP